MRAIEVDRGSDANDTMPLPVRCVLAEHLLAAGRLPVTTLERAERLALESGEKLDAVLTRLGLITERELAEIFAQSFNIPLVSANQFPTEPVLDGRFTAAFLKLARVLPIADRPEGVMLAMADPTDEQSVEAIAFAAEKPVLRLVACATDLDAAWERLYGAGDGRLAAAAEAAGDGGSDDIERLKDLASEAPVIRLVNQIIARAIELRASDIHLEPMAGKLRLRYRVDGVLHETEGPPERLRHAVVSRIKVMAKLNIAERRLAQDGQIRLAIRGQEIDLRVATAPTIHGEAVALRILDRGSLALDFRTLGFDEALIQRWQTVLAEPHGIVLVTGPTGSGKTTTLYASLLTLNTLDRKILTVEDPVEYQLDGINQVQVKPQIGLTFAGALRSFLRHDPDIMMIGEIRDLETAQIAVQAALTGHLILSTLHTNDAASAVTRLIDMGVEDYLLVSTVNAVAAQRLVRTLCPECREPYQPLPQMAARLGIDSSSLLYRPVGCAACDGTGFRGRTTIIELLVMSDASRQLVLDRAPAKAVLAQAVSEGMRTLFQDGVRKALAGVTTVEEVLRASREQ
jgi:general secretion pathway protein E